MAEGDLTQKVTVDVKGEILELKNTVNTMVDQLSSFATRSRALRARWGPRASSAARPRSRCRAPGAAHRVGEPDGRQPDGPGALDRAGVDRRGRGRPLAEDRGRGKGEVAALADTINKMVDRLRSFAAEVTRVAREVGPRASSAARPRSRTSGTWRGLTENVN